MWLAGPGGDETLARELGMRLAREPALAELELMYGPGIRPAPGCSTRSPSWTGWSLPAATRGSGSRRTRRSARYLLEEAYEAYDAIEAHDLTALREELGDVLLQVVLHARMAEEADEPWSVDDLAGGLVDKLVRRNPHVFGRQISPTSTRSSKTGSGSSGGAQEGPRLRREGRSALDGVARAQPALALAAKISRAPDGPGIEVPVAGRTGRTGPPVRRHSARPCSPSLRTAEERGLDAEAALRRAALAHAEAVRAAEG